MYENRYTRRIFGPKRNEVAGGYRKLHNEELCNLYSSLSIIRMIKPRTMRWAGYISRMGEKSNAYRILWEIKNQKRPLGTLEVGGRILLKRVLKRYLTGSG
jgi:hypothetical protein